MVRAMVLMAVLLGGGGAGEEDWDWPPVFPLTGCFQLPVGQFLLGDPDFEEGKAVQYFLGFPCGASEDLRIVEDESFRLDAYVVRRGQPEYAFRMLWKVVATAGGKTEEKVELYFVTAKVELERYLEEKWREAGGSWDKALCAMMGELRRQSWRGDSVGEPRVGKLLKKFLRLGLGKPAPVREVREWDGMILLEGFSTVEDQWRVFHMGQMRKDSLLRWAEEVRQLAWPRLKEEVEVKPPCGSPAAEPGPETPSGSN